METGLAEIDSCASPPSPDFSLDSSSPFANGLHFESILFEDEEEEDAMDTEAEARAGRAPCGSRKDRMANTGSKTKLDVKLCPTRSKKSKVGGTLDQDVNFEDVSKSDGGLSSLVSSPAGIIMASSGSVHSLPSNLPRQIYFSSLSPL